jgi:hypothetical protein
VIPVLIALLLPIAWAPVANAQQTVLLDCQSGHQGISVRLEVAAGETVMTIRTPADTAHVCRTRAPDFFDGRKAVEPHWRGTFRLRGCSPGLPAEISKRMSPQVTFWQRPWAKQKSTLDWLNDSAPTDCVIRTNRLEEFLSGKGKD